MSLSIENKFIEKIKEARTVAIFMHNSPDGDCIGSAVALEESCKQLGKRVDLIIQDRIPKRFSPIIGEKRVEKIMMPPQGKMYDLAILLDCADPRRTVSNIKHVAKSLMVIDHHPIDKPYGDLYLYREVAATGMIIYEVIKRLGNLNETMSTAIYFSIVSDTGGFKNENTNPLVFKICADLLKNGANIETSTKIYENKALSFLHLLGTVLKQVSYDPKYKITSLSITRDDIESSGASDNEAALVIDYIRGIENSDVCILFIEGYHNIRIRARSKILPVNQVLNYFGGGGHEKAAGCAIENSNLNYVRNEVIDYFKCFIDRKNEN